MKSDPSPGSDSLALRPTGFTLIELLVVIAIIAILAVVVVLTLNPAQLLAQSRDANRVSDMATLQSALNLYVTDQAGASTFNLGSTASTGISIYDPNGSSTCGSLGLLSLGSSTWYCGTSTSSRSIGGSGWIPVNLSLISAGAPIGSLPVDPVNQTSSGLFYAYNTNGSQFEVTSNLESSKYKAQYGKNPSTTLFPEVISGGTPTISALYNATGLVGYWPMDDGNGSTTIDQTGNGNTGTWGGTPTGGTYYTSGKIGTYAGAFNHFVDISSFPSILSLAGSSRTVCAWFNTSNSSLRQGIVSTRPTSSNNGWVLELTASQGLQYYATGGSGLSINSVITANTWYDTCATYNAASTTAMLYLNGTLATSSTSFAPDTAGSFTGAIGWEPGDFFSGSIDEVRIYNRALSPAEVLALYTAEK